MSKLLIITQIYENYGAHDWDGVGTCPQYWKAKGGNEYVVKDVGEASAYAAAQLAARQVEQDNEYFTETVIDFRVVEDDYLTEFEQSQLEYDGAIAYPATVLTV